MRISLVVVAVVALDVLVGAGAGASQLVQAADRPEIALWPDGLPTGAKPVDAERAEKLRKSTDAERIRYVDTPSITVYRAPADKSNGCAVVVCPGGGYNILAWPKEGLELAEWFNSLGVTAAVLKYRVPRRDPDAPHVEPLQDAQRAMRLVRHHAEDWKIDPDRVGILGFSAGGHLAVMTGTHWDQPAYKPTDAIDELSCRPNFMCPIYAAYLGPDYNDSSPKLGPLVRVSARTPPTFLAVTADDSHRGSQAALLFVELRMRKVPAEVHVYSKGGHGYGIRPSDNPVSTWHLRLSDWLKAHGFLNQRAASK